MTAGCWLLSQNCWLLGAGCLLVAAGRWLLAAGCWLLAADKYFVEYVTFTCREDSQNYEKYSATVSENLRRTFFANRIRESLAADCWLMSDDF